MSATALLRLSSMGDILLTEPVPRWLKRQEPERRLVYITRERFAGIPRGWPDVDEVLSLAEPLDGACLARLRRRLRELDVTRRLDLHNTLRSHRIWPRCEARLPKHRLYKWWLVHGKGLPGRPAAPAPVWRRYLELVGAGSPGEELRPRLVVEGRQLSYGARRHISLVPGAGYATKCWPEEHWRRLLDLLVAALPEPVLLLGGPGERELGDRLAAAQPGRTRNLCGSLSLEESARLVADSRLLIGGDTGLLHMADAAGVPGVALYGSTVRELGFFPHGKTLQVLERSLACRPCSHVGRKACPLGHLDCLKGIQPSQVLEACLAAEGAC